MLLAAVRAEFPRVKLTVDANTDYRMADRSRACKVQLTFAGDAP